MKLSLKTAVFNWRLGENTVAWTISRQGSPIWRVEDRINQYVVVNLHREFRYGVTTADEGLRPISPSKLKYPPHPSGRRY